MTREFSFLEGRCEERSLYSNKEIVMLVWGMAHSYTVMLRREINDIQNIFRTS